MKRTHLLYSLVLAALCGSLIAAQGTATKHSAETHTPPRTSSSKAQDGSTKVQDEPSTEAGAKVIQYGDKDIVRLKTKLRYTTLIVLPKSEQILDFSCGDKELWVVNGNQNFAYIKPAKVGAQTNLNLVTASGNIYSFVLNEVSEVAEAT